MPFSDGAGKEVRDDEHQSISIDWTTQQTSENRSNSVLPGFRRINVVMPVSRNNRQRYQSAQRTPALGLTEFMFYWLHPVSLKVLDNHRRNLYYLATLLGRVGLGPSPTNHSKSHTIGEFIKGTVATIIAQFFSLNHDEHSDGDLHAGLVMESWGCLPSRPMGDSMGTRR